MKKIITTLIILSVLFFLIKLLPANRISSKMTLPDINGNQISLCNLKGKEFGVIGYFSKTPCGGHNDVGKKYINSYNSLFHSHRYHLSIIYGDENEYAAMNYVNNYDVPVLLDVEKQFAKKYRIRYYAVIVYNSKGKILVFNRERTLNGRTDIYLLNHALLKKKVL
jgi:hypothetical protein